MLTRVCKIFTFVFHGFLINTVNAQDLDTINTKLMVNTKTFFEGGYSAFHILNPKEGVNYLVLGDENSEIRMFDNDYRIRFLCENCFGTMKLYEKESMTLIDSQRFVVKFMPVSIIARKEKGGSFYCGDSIISEDFHNIILMAEVINHNISLRFTITEYEMVVVNKNECSNYNWNTPFFSKILVNGVENGSTILIYNVKISLDSDRYRVLKEPYILYVK